MTARLPWHFRWLFLTALVWSSLCLWWSYGRVGHAVPGAMVTIGGIVDPISPADWTGHRAGLRPFDRIVSYDGLPLANVVDLHRYVATKPVGTVVRFGIARAAPQGLQRLVIDVPTERFDMQDWISWGGLPGLAGLAHLLIGALAYRWSPASLQARRHWYFCLALAVFLAGFPSLGLGIGAAQPVTILAECLVLPLGVSLAASLPRRWPWLPVTLQLGCWVGIGALLVAISAGSLRAVVFVSVLAMAGVMAVPASALWAWLSPSSQNRERQQAVIILAGAVLAYLPGTLATMVAHLSATFGNAAAWGLATALIFPLSVAYAIISRQLFAIEAAVRRSTYYVLLVACLSAVYVSMTAVGGLLFGQWLTDWLPVDLAGLAGALAVSLVFRPLQSSLRHRIDRLFLGERADAVQVLAAVSRIVPGDPDTVARTILSSVSRALQPTWALILVDGRRLAEIGTAPDGIENTLTGMLADAPGHVVAIADGLHVVLHGSAGGSSLLLGPRLADMPYADTERSLLRALAVQGGVALTNARLRVLHADLCVQEGITRALAEERRQVLRQVFHDLRTDLMNIALAVDLAPRMPGNDYPVRAIRESVDRIERFLDDKSPAAVTDDGASVPAAMQAVARILQEPLRMKGQILSMLLVPEPLRVGLTPVALEQVLTNLVGNAGKFAPAGTTIRLSADRAGNEVVVTVSDEGPGIPEGLLGQFGSGERGDPAIPGLGLGLQNVRDLVVMAGGRVGWRNAERGAVVEVRLPEVGAL